MDRIARTAPRFAHSIALLSKIDFHGLSPRSLARTFSRGRSYNRITRYDINSFHRSPPNSVSYNLFFDRPRYPAFSPRFPTLWPRFQRSGLIYSFGTLNLFGWSQTDYFRPGRARLRWKGWYEKRKFFGRFTYARAYGSARFSFFYRGRRAYRRRRRTLVAIRRAKWGRPVLRRLTSLFPRRSFSLFSLLFDGFDSDSFDGYFLDSALENPTVARLSALVSRSNSAPLVPVPGPFSPTKRFLSNLRFRAGALFRFSRRPYRWRFRTERANSRWISAGVYRRWAARRLRKPRYSFPKFVNIGGGVMHIARKKHRFKSKKRGPRPVAKRPYKKQRSRKRFTRRRRQRLKRFYAIRRRLGRRSKWVVKASRHFSRMRRSSGLRSPLRSCWRRRRGARRSPRKRPSPGRLRFAHRSKMRHPIPASQITRLAVQLLRKIRVSVASRERLKKPAVQVSKPKSIIPPAKTVVKRQRVKRKPRRSPAARRRRSRRRARHRARWDLSGSKRSNRARILRHKKKAKPTRVKFKPRFNRVLRRSHQPARALRRRWASSRKYRHPARRLLNRLYPFAKGLRLANWFPFAVRGLISTRVRRYRARFISGYFRRLRGFRAFSRPLHKSFKLRFLYRFASYQRSSSLRYLRYLGCSMRSRYAFVTFLRFLGASLNSFRSEVSINVGRVDRVRRLGCFFYDHSSSFVPFVLPWARFYYSNPVLIASQLIGTVNNTRLLLLSSPYWASAIGGSVGQRSQFFSSASLAASRIIRALEAYWPTISYTPILTRSASRWFFGVSSRFGRRRHLHSRFLLPTLFALRHQPRSARQAAPNLFNFTLYDHSYVHYTTGRFKRSKNKRRARFRLR